MDTPRYVDINKIHAKLPVLKDNGDYLLSTSDVNMAIRLALAETENVVEVVRCKDTSLSVDYAGWGCAVTILGDLPMKRELIVDNFDFGDELLVAVSQCAVTYDIRTEIADGKVTVILIQKCGEIAGEIDRAFGHIRGSDPKDVTDALSYASRLLFVKTGGQIPHKAPRTNKTHN